MSNRPILPPVDLGFIGPPSSRHAFATHLAPPPPPPVPSRHTALLEVAAHPSHAQAAAAPEPRKSSRAKTSTLIYVDGHAIRKENNYVVNGTEYVYGGAVGTDQPPPSRSTAPRKNVAPTPRVVTAVELARREQKRALEAAITEKQAARQAFLKENLHHLRPFLEPKVVQRIQDYSPAQKHQQKRAPLYMQPDAITGDMRDYQLEGLNFMSTMYSKNMGMILGDEMGLGKTLQTIALVCHLKQVYGKTGPSLIVCPMSVLYSWCSEIEKWAPSLKFLRFHNSHTESMNVEGIQDYDMIVTTYEMIKSPALKSMWQRQQFHLLVLDEGHRIKSADTQVAQAARKIHCENRIILTGTPLANNLVEMWSLLNFLAPDVFTTSQPFVEAFDLQRNVVDRAKLEEAHHVLKVFMLRRLKDEVEKLMPKKLETKVICPLSDTQIWWYKAILLKDLKIITGQSKTKAKMLSNLIMQLRKVCIHPFLFPEAEDIDSTTLNDLVGASGKLAVLDKLLCSLYKKGHRVVLFSQFTSVLDILDDYCTLRGWNYCRFDGGTARAKRNYIVNSFNEPDSQKFVFLMSTRSGGMGLNLQTADTCILFDSDWNPQPDIQAMARVHRLGQKKTVHVYRLVTEGTVEQRMVERAEKKLYLDRMVTRDGISEDLVEETEDAEKLLSTLKFGCNAVFGEGTDKNHLPSDEDIEVITDRNRTEDYSTGKLKGGADASTEEFDATKQFTSTTNFGGIDFKKIRQENRQKEKSLESMSLINDQWKKRQRKNRIMMVQAAGSGYGSVSVPVLAANDYDLQSGERSVFQQELRGRSEEQGKKKKKGPSYESQDFCQSCGDGGLLVCCPRCPVSLHLTQQCAGVTHEKHFLSCSHHRCTVCSKPPTEVGGFLFPCSACTSAFCEDHLPDGSRFLEKCDRMEKLGHKIKLGVYVHCSKKCEEIAMKEFGYQVPGPQEKAPCPPSLDMSNSFGKAVDDSIDAPEDVQVSGKRRRKVVNYSSSPNVDNKPKPKPSGTVASNWFGDDRGIKKSRPSDESTFASPPSESSDEEIECLGTMPAPSKVAVLNVLNVGTSDVPVNLS